MNHFRKLSAVLIPVLIIALFFILKNASEKSGSAVQTIGPAAVSSQLAAPPALAQIGSTSSFADVAEKTVNSVVSISSTRVVRAPNSQFQFPFNDPFFQRFFGEDQSQAPQDIREQALGSGVIIDQNGTIITNNHVVEGASELKVTLFNDKEYDAEIIGTDPPTDVAVIRLKGDGLSDLVPMKWGDSDAMRLGDIVLAIGNPFGLGQTLSMGIISAKGRSGVGIETYEDFIQTDAAINPGNSGGALVNMKGELVGINTAIASETGGNQGIGFAIPSNMASQIMKTLITQGKVVRGWLGVGIQDVTPDLAKALNLPSATGVIVSNVFGDGPAAKAGIQVGDVLTSIDGKQVTGVQQLQTLVAGYKPNSQAKFTVIRESKQTNVTVTLGTREEQPQIAQNMPQQQPQRGQQQVQGLTVAPLDNQIRQQLDIPSDVNGVVITGIDPNSPEANAGLQEGDVIRAVNRKSVNSTSDFNSLYDRAKGNILLYVFRGGNNFFVSVNK